MDWILKSNSEPVFSLSGNELCVMAAIYGIVEFYGVRNNLFKKDSESYLKSTTETVDRLMKKQLLDIDIKGEFLFDEELEQFLQIVYHPAYICGIEILRKGRICKSCYCYMDDADGDDCHIYAVSLTQPGQYQVSCLHSQDEIMEMLPIFKKLDTLQTDGGEPIIISRLQTSKLHEYLHSFQEDKVLDFIEEMILHEKDSQCAEYLCQALKGEGKYIQLYRKVKGGDTFGCSILQIKNVMYKLELEGGDRVCLYPLNNIT